MLRKRGDVWHLDTVIDGVRYRCSLETTDFREAKQREKNRIADAKEGKLAASGQEFARLGFTLAVERYRNERMSDLKPRSIQTMTERSKPICAYFGNKCVRKVTLDDLLGYRTKRVQQDRCSNSTYNWELDILRGVLKRAKCWRKFTDDIKSLRKPETIGRALEPKEKARLLATAKSRPEWEVAYLAQVLALTTTMRGAELKSLQWRDIDLMNEEVTIRDSKTNAGKRTIPLNGEALAAVLRLRERSKLLFGDSLSPNWFVFPSMKANVRPVAGPTQPMKGWRNAWRKLTKKAGLAGFRFHDCRHHAITELAEGQNSEATMMAIAGHISKAMLERYSHIRTDAKRAAVNGLVSPKAENAIPVQEETKRVPESVAVRAN